MFTNNIGKHETCYYCGKPKHQYGDPPRQNGDNYCDCSVREDEINYGGEEVYVIAKCEIRFGEYDSLEEVTIVQRQPKNGRDYVYLRQSESGRYDNYNPDMPHMHDMVADLAEQVRVARRFKNKDAGFGGLKSAIR